MSVQFLVEWSTLLMCSDLQGVFIDETISNGLQLVSPDDMLELVVSDGAMQKHRNVSMTFCKRHDTIISKTKTDMMILRKSTIAKEIYKYLKKEGKEWRHKLKDTIMQTRQQNLFVKA